MIPLQPKELEDELQKKFVEKALERVESITADKYDRRLGKVMVSQKDGSYLYLN